MQCFYDLWLPFDHQACHTKLQLKKHQDIRIITNHLKSSVTFSGNKLLTEFEITDYYLFSSENEEGVEFGYSIEFKRLYLKQITTLYFQLILLWIVAYLTLYIEVNDFSNRFMGAVTALRVMSTLMDNINKQLPVSPQICLIDIWNILYVSQIILIIIFHIFANGLLNKKSVNPKNSNPKAWQQTLLLQPQKLNAIEKTGFPILNRIFTLYFICHNIHTIYKKMLMFSITKTLNE